MSRPRPAPVAARSAISFCRAVPRGEQQVRDVRARDQQHEADRAEQERQSAASRRRRTPSCSGTTRAAMPPGFLAARLEHLPA